MSLRRALWRAGVAGRVPVTALVALSFLVPLVPNRGADPASVDATADAAADVAAKYQVTFVPSWNPATHPHEYPYSHARHGLLTPIIGASHGERWTPFAPGRRPSPGLERLSEMGKHDPLDAEIKKAIADGHAGTLIQFRDGSPGPVHPAVGGSFEIDREHPMVSLVGMIAPSPDWFYGVASVELMRGDRWVPMVSVEAFAWDSGGDCGATYMAEDMDLDPKQMTRMADTAHFVQNGRYVPVGVFVFKRVPK